jgi:hypothetical protein
MEILVMAQRSRFGSLSIVLGGLSIISATAFGAACNPTVYDKLIEEAWVETFSLRGVTAGNSHGRHVLTYEPLDDGEGHLLIAGADTGMTWLRINRVGSPQPEYATLDQLKALIPPIETVDYGAIGGLAKVPASDGSPNQFAVVAFKDSGIPERAHTESFRLPGFAKSNVGHIEAPEVEGSTVGAFGEGLAAINLDADQSDPDYELLIGSDRGVLLYDNMGKNLADYAINRTEAIANGTLTAANEEEGYGFTRCADLDVRNGLTAGKLLMDQAPIFVVGTAEGLTFVGGNDSGPNVVGAPIFDCDVASIPAPGGSGISFGFSMLAGDLDWDIYSVDVEGFHDLVVGDPSANLVHIYVGSNGGISPTPITLAPPDSDTKEFGYSVGKANLGGDLGHVLLVGAPGSRVGGKEDVGRVLVYDAVTFELITTLEDQEPGSGSRHGIWTGGMPHDDWSHDELVVLGYTEGRVHLAINGEDSAAGAYPP